MLRETDWERLREIAKGGGERNCGRLWRVVKDCESCDFREIVGNCEGLSEIDCEGLSRVVRVFLRDCEGL